MAETLSSREILDRALRLRAKGVAADPRVPLTIRVGGTGHRIIDPMYLDRINAALCLIFQRIRSATESVFVARASSAEHTGVPELFVISPLAEGADRLIATAGLKEGFRLGAILPFDAAAYESTFDISKDRQLAIDEFHTLLANSALPRGYGVLTLDGDCSPQGQTLSYRDCATALAEWCDVLVTILQPERVHSETELSLRVAIERKLPVVIVNPLAPEKFQLAINGEVLNAKECGPAELEQMIEKIIGPGIDGVKSAHAFAEFRSEEITCGPSLTTDYESSGPYNVSTIAPFWFTWFMGLNSAIMRAFHWISVELHRKTSPTSRVHASDLAFDSGCAGAFVDLFLRYQRADALATAYGNLHRSGQIVTVVLSIAIAIMGVIDSREGGPVALTIVEFALLLYVLALVTTAHRQRWLERWLNYRLVADVLRCAKFLLVTGRSALFAEAELVRAADNTTFNWTHNYCRDVLRALRLAMPGRAIEIKPDAREKATTYLIHQCIDGQITYHAKTSALRENADRLLRMAGTLIIGATFFILIAKVLVHFWPAIPGQQGLLTRAGQWLHMIDEVEMLMPAIAGALLALRAYGEHTIVVHRSKTLLSALEAQRRQLEIAPGICRLQQLLPAVVSAQLRDVDGWFELFSDKPLEM